MYPPLMMWVYYAGSQWGLWTGAIEGDVAVMVAIVTGGYHGISSYQWAQEEQVIEKEVFPIIYVTEPGMYKCSVCIQPKIVVDLKFAVGCKEYTVVVCN